MISTLENKTLRKFTETSWASAIALTILLLVFTSTIDTTSALSYRGYKQEMKEQPDDVLIDLIARYGHTMLRAKDELENSKRTVDFGLSRGYSARSTPAFLQCTLAGCTRYN
uniref:Uncharacterized protein n=1 Tax=Anopheles culicifacies TaxID=139723 RepID=A0A182MWV1_9DIPT